MSPSLQTIIERGRFTGLSDTQAVRLFGRAFEKEIEALQNAEATVESGADKPPGSLVDGKTPSRYLYGKDYAEVNRTLVNMLALKWILADNYDAFTGNQNPEARLSPESWKQLREFFQDRVQDNPDDLREDRIDIYALLVAIVLDDLGKAPDLAKVLEEHRDPSLDKLKNHSDILYEAAFKKEIPLLEDVPEKRREIIKRSMQIEGKLNISQLVQAENVPANLSVVWSIKEQGDSLDMRAMVTLLDVAGAAAHMNANGCLVMGESVYQGYISALKALNDFIDGKIATQRECYDRVLSDRAKVLHNKGYELLSTDDAEQRALLRLFCMGRVDNPKQADIFKRSLNALSTDQKTDLINGLNVDGINDGKAILPYYAPGLTSEVLRAFRGKDDATVINALSAFMRFLARVLGGTKPEPDTPGTVEERDLAYIQGVIKGGDFRANPSILDQQELPPQWSQ